jgi:hypothetical protein
MKGLVASLRRLLLFYGGLALLILAIGWYLSSQLKRVDPEAWTKSVAELTGVKVAAAKSVSQNVTLTDDQKSRLSSSGKDLALVNRAIQTYGWCVQQFGDDACDPALWITLTNGESANCNNAGDAPALAEMRKRGFTDQIAAFNVLLPIWQRNKIRDNPNSRSKGPNLQGHPYVPEDYNPELVRGSAGAGALGCSQFMAGTAKIHLAEIGEPFDLWEPDTAMKLMAAETVRLGYRKSKSPAANIQAMLGWNQDRTWITSIVSDAQALASSIGQVAKDVPQTKNDLKAAAPEIFAEQTGEQKFLLALLNFVGLGPDVKQVQAEAEAQQAAKVAGSLQKSGTLPTPGAAITGTKTVSLDLGSEVPQNDGEKENVILWSTLNKSATLVPGATWDFCTQTNQTGWGGYRIGGGVEAGGICFNASMLKELAQANPDKIQIVTWAPHAPKGWARLHTVIWCPGTSLTLKNISNETFSIVWAQSGNNLTVSIQGDKK